MDISVAQKDSFRLEMDIYMQSIQILRENVHAFFPKEWKNWRQNASQNLQLTSEFTYVFPCENILRINIQTLHEVSCNSILIANN